MYERVRIGYSSITSFTGSNCFEQYHQPGKCLRFYSPLPTLLIHLGSCRASGDNVGLFFPQALDSHQMQYSWGLLGWKTTARFTDICSINAMICTPRIPMQILQLTKDFLKVFSRRLAIKEICICLCWARFISNAIPSKLQVKHVDCARFAQTIVFQTEKPSKMPNMRRH